MSMNSDYSGSYTRNAEAGAVLRPHNLGLSKVIIPSSAYNNYNNANFRPSNPAVAKHLKYLATDTGRESNMAVMRDHNRLRIGNTGHGGAEMRGGDAGDVLSTIASFLPFLL